ncbi:hypothetical protein FTX61_01160 [Nitriliruptoraceae bacterium ZYF776]|nr:hypothetical protein [Profundirhabdus halotolerans]
MSTATLTVRPTPAAAPHEVQAVGLAPLDRASAWRRRAGAVLALVVLAFLLTVAIGRVTAGADLADPVAGHHVVQPGESLWEVAAATAPAGTDTRDQLARIVELNGFTSERVDAWTVVLLPVR